MPFSIGQILAKVDGDIIIIGNVTKVHNDLYRRYDIEWYEPEGENLVTNYEEWHVEIFKNYWETIRLYY
jgi:hypothetical protein